MVTRRTDNGYDDAVRRHITCIDHYGSSWKYDFDESVSPGIEAFQIWHESPVFTVWFRNKRQISINVDTHEIKEMGLLVCGEYAARFVKNQCVTCGKHWREHSLVNRPEPGA